MVNAALEQQQNLRNQAQHYTTEDLIAGSEPKPITALNRDILGAVHRLLPIPSFSAHSSCAAHHGFQRRVRKAIMNTQCTNKLILSLASLFLVFSCGETEELIDCGQICSRYDECVADLDVSDCTGRCEDSLDENAGYEEAADVCEECIESGTCAEVEACWADCPVVSTQTIE